MLITYYLTQQLELWYIGEGGGGGEESPSALAYQVVNLGPDL